MTKKYTFTDETIITHDGVQLHRIKRLSDGRLGGWIEKESNLSHEGDCWVDENARVYGNAWVFGNARVYGDAWVYGNARVYGYAWVYGDARVFGNARVYGDAWVYGYARVYGDAWVYGNARVSGNARVRGGKWKTSPLYIQGSRDPVTHCNHSEITIGCEVHSFDYWLEKYKEIGKANRYTEKEIEEYKKHIDYIISCA